jgi:hypothetical protein
VPALNSIVLMDASAVTVTAWVRPVASKVAVPVDTLAGTQLALVFQLPLADPLHVAFCACARLGASTSAPASAVPASTSLWERGPQPTRRRCRDKASPAPHRRSSTRSM